MDVVATILAERDLGVVHCGVSRLDAPTLTSLAAEFGLWDDPAIYREINAEAARRLLRAILRHDMAYHAEIMAEARAAELADRFVDEFAADEARYFTNGSFHLADETDWLAGWNAATRATFDTGVLILGPVRSGCLWVEDED